MSNTLSYRAALINLVREIQKFHTINTKESIVRLEETEAFEQAIELLEPDISIKRKAKEYND